MNRGFFATKIIATLQAEFGRNKTMSLARNNIYYDHLKFLPEDNWDKVMEHIIFNFKGYPKPQEIVSLYKQYNPKAFPKPEGDYVDQWEKKRNANDAIVAEAVQKALRVYEVIYQQSIREGWDCHFLNVLQQIAELQMYAIDASVSYGYTVSLLPIRFNADSEEVKKCVAGIYAQVDNQHLTRPHVVLSKEQLQIIRYNWRLLNPDVEMEDEPETNQKKEKTGHIGETLNKILP